MKHKLNYTVEAGSKLTTLFIFFHSQKQRAKAVADPDLQIRGGGGGGHPHPEIRGGEGGGGHPAGSATAMYLAGGSFVFACDAAGPHIDLILLKSSTTEQPCKRIK